MGKDASMIQSLDGDSVIGPELRREKLSDYWRDYFDYAARGADLYDLTQNSLLNIVATAKTEARPYIDSQIKINELLTELGARHSFHRQFNEQFPNMKPAQVLGMQLYALLAADADTWRYLKTTRPGHLFSHSTYFISR
jgi:hypothetical protein